MVKKGSSYEQCRAKRVRGEDTLDLNQNGHGSYDQMMGTRHESKVSVRERQAQSTSLGGGTEQTGLEPRLST